METSLQHKRILLKPREEKRFAGGHPWVFSNQLLKTDGDPETGDLVEISTSQGDTVGFGFFNPHSLITCRILTKEYQVVDTAFFVDRISAALDLRKKLYPNGTAYRIVHGESDFMPGLVVDRYNDFLSLQTFSAGMDKHLPEICDALSEIFSPSGIIERNESHLRTLEGLPQKKGVLRGASGTTTITEGELRYEVDPLHGQKTGFYLDQRENRLATRRFAAGKRVLDCFCNDGGFGLQAAAGGADSVVAVDSSKEAIERAVNNSRLNGISTVSFEESDVFDTLKAFAEKGESFGLIILDPPSFARSRKNVATARKGYRNLHSLAFQCLERGGTLATASCSHHIRPDVFLDIIADSAKRAGRDLQQLAWLGASPDHPTIPTVSETSYLKFGLFNVR